MKNFIINPAAAEFQVELRASVEDMERQGWDLDEYHQNLADSFDYDFESAREDNCKDYIFYLDLKGTPEKPVLLYGLYSHGRNEYSEPQQTGDDEQTMRDIIEMLNSGDMWVQVDDSTDAEGEDVITFVEEVTA